MAIEHGKGIAKLGLLMPTDTLTVYEWLHIKQKVDFDPNKQKYISYTYYHVQLMKT